MLTIDDRDRAIARAAHYLTTVHRMQPQWAREVATMAIDAATWNVTASWRSEFMKMETSHE